MLIFAQRYICEDCAHLARITKQKKFKITKSCAWVNKTGWDAPPAARDRTSKTVKKTQCLNQVGPCFVTIRGG